MDEIQFDAATHRYRVGGVPKLGCTEALAQAGLIEATWFTDRSRIIGEYVHEAARLYDAGALDEDSLDKVLMPYLEAWKRFRVEAPFFPDLEWIERQIYSAPHGVCGCVDRVGIMGKVRTLVDIKTGVPSSWHQLQTAIYCKAVPEAMARGCCYLKNDGSYRWVAHRCDLDHHAAQAAIVLAGWARVNEMKGEKKE